MCVRVCVCVFGKVFQGRTKEGADVAIKQLHYEDVSARERDRE